jgi:hypothetical protein
MFQRPRSWAQMLLSVGFVGLMAADVTQVLPELPGSDRLDKAFMLPMIHIQAARKVYDDEGNFIRCLRGGNDCYVVYNTLAGDLNVSTDGIHLQPK